LKFLKEKYIYIVFASTIWIYLLLRSVFVPILHDEAATFYHYVISGSFIPYFSNCESNNHILNTLLTYISYHLFGLSKLVLRLPNLLSAIIFFFFIYKISFRIKSGILRWLFILSLAGSCYFMEFFTMCRGYGISMALLMGSLWYLWLILKDGGWRHYFLCLLFIFLAVTANLTLIITFLLIIVLLLLHFLFNFKKTGIKTRIITIILLLFAGFLPALFSVIYLFLLKKNGALYYGTTNGFWDVTVKSLVRALTVSENMIFVYMALVFFIFVLLTYIAAFIRSKKFLFLIEKNYLFHFLLIGNIVATLMVSKILHTNYPEDRVGLYFFPLLIGSVFFSLDILQKKIRWIWIPSLLLLFFPVHFILSLNLTHNTFFRSDRIPYSFFNDVQKYHKSIQPPTVGGNYMRKLCWSFMNFENGGKEGRIQDDDYPNPDADFQIVKKADSGFFSRDYSVIDEDGVSGKYLLKRKKYLDKEILSEYKGLHTNGEINDEFFTLSEGRLDTLKHNSLYLGFNLLLTHKEKPFIAWVVVEVRGSDDKSIKYEFIAFDWLRENWNNVLFANNILVHDVPENATTFIAYIWNIHKKKYTLQSGSTSIYRLKKDY